MIGPLVEERARLGSHHKRMPVAFSGVIVAVFFVFFSPATKQCVLLPPPISSWMCWPWILGGVCGCDGPRLSLTYLHSINLKKTKSSLCLSRERCLEYRARVLENVVFIRACHFMGRLFALYGRYFQAHSRKKAKERAFCKVWGSSGERRVYI